MQRLDSSAGGGGGAAADLLQPQPQQSEDDILMEAEAVLAASSATTAATTTAQQLNRAEQQRVDGRVELVVSIFRLTRFHGTNASFALRSCLASNFHQDHKLWTTKRTAVI